MSVSIEKQAKAPAGVDSNGDPAPAICGACGKEFGCGANLACGATPSDCWCFDVKLNETALAELQSRYRGCLCNRCLLAFVADQPGVKTRVES